MTKKDEQVAEDERIRREAKLLFIDLTFHKNQIEKINKRLNELKVMQDELSKER